MQEDVAQAVTTEQAAVLRSGETRPLLVWQQVPFLYTDHSTSCTVVPFGMADLLRLCVYLLAAHLTTLLRTQILLA
jgi:hypothetical protein